MRNRRISFVKIPGEKGQSFVELSFVFIVLIVLIGTVVEFGFLFLSYMGLQEAVRNAARYSSDGQYLSRDDDMDCLTTRDFYRQTYCLVNQELNDQRPLVELNLAEDDDIIISVFAIKGLEYPGVIVPHVSARFPVEYGEDGYSEAEDWGVGRNQVSQIPTDYINDHLNTSAPSTGIVSIEIFYHYHQLLHLPWVTAIVPDPLLIRAYAIMPLVSAEPQLP